MLFFHALAFRASTLRVAMADRKANSVQTFRSIALGACVKYCKRSGGCAWGLPFILLAQASGCAVLAPYSLQTESIGAPSRGALVRATAVPERGPGYELFRSESAGGMVHTTRRLRDGVFFAARRIQSDFAHSANLRIGDFSAPSGGQIDRHRSHRNGRDVDILFYALDATTGESVLAPGFVRYNRDGNSLDSEHSLRFDDARNWALVEGLVQRNETGVIWIFCAGWLRQRLLVWAQEHHRDPRWIERARRVLHQPGDAAPHDDHFHVRVSCTSIERLDGCLDGGLEHWWLRRDLGKPDAAPSEENQR